MESCSGTPKSSGRITSQDRDCCCCPRRTWETWVWRLKDTSYISRYQAGVHIILSLKTCPYTLKFKLIGNNPSMFVNVMCILNGTCISDSKCMVKSINATEFQIIFIALTSKTTEPANPQHSKTTNKISLIAQLLLLDSNEIEWREHVYWGLQQQTVLLRNPDPNILHAYPLVSQKCSNCAQKGQDLNINLCKQYEYLEPMNSRNIRDSVRFQWNSIISYG